MESDEEEKRNQKKIAEQNILTEDEIIDALDMAIYRERIEKIIGRQYSYLYFVYFENIYQSKIKNKMSYPLNEYLNKENNFDDTLWMHIYKSIKFYSKDNLPIIITKYFHLKAETEFKFLYNESKKYTNNSFKFFDTYIKKMKKANNKKLNEFKSKNPNVNIFDTHKKQSFYIRSFLSKKTVLRPKLSVIKNSFLLNNNNNQEDEHSELSNKEQEIKNKKEMRVQIMKKIHQLKINTIKEVEKANILQNKQKKKYGGIKSRFLDAYNQQEKFFKIISSMSGKKIYKNNYQRQLTDIEDTYPSTTTQKKFNNSKSSSKTYLYLNSKENYSSRKNINLKLFSEEKKNNNYYLKNQSNYSKNNSKINYFRNDIYMRGFSAKSKKKKNLNMYDINYKNSTPNKIKSMLNKFKEKSKYNRLNTFFNIKKEKSKKNGLNIKPNNTGIIIKNLEQKRKIELLENLKVQKDENEGYNNILYNIFKRTEIF